MRISESQFNNILERYLRNTQGLEVGDIDILKVKYASQFKKAIEYIEANVNGDLLNLAAFGAAVEITFQEQAEKFALFSKFLNAALIEKNEQLTFDLEVAIAAKAKILDPNLSILKVVNIYDNPNNLGIREKYSRGLLTAAHWLTDTDLQRMLEISGANSEISILPFTAKSLGASLHFAHHDNQANNAPYTLSYLLNAGNGHWIAAKINVDPVANKIGYIIEDSLNLSESAKKNYEALIEAAIKYDDGFHKAYPNAIIDKESCHINGNAAQKDGYSCGYRALQFLMQDPTIHKEHPVAKAYGELDERDSANLVRSFYTTQLQDFAVPKDIYDVLNSKGRSLFSAPVANASAVKVKSDSLEQFIKQLPEKVVTSSPDTLHKAVEECVGKYTPGMVLLRFPSGAKVKDLDAIQYSSLFEELATNEQLLNTPLPNFILASCDLAALDGLNSFYAEQSVTLFNALEIAVDLEKGSDADTFAAKLNFALNNLSRTHLNRLTIKDEKATLAEKHIQELLEFARNRKISFVIDLPGTYRNSQYQKQLDEIVSINRREKNSNSLTEKLSKDESKKEKVKVVRSRERIDLRSAMKIDIELQEGVEETAAISKGVKKQKAANDYSEINVIDLSQLQDSACKDDFGAFKSSSFGMTKTNLIEFWHQLCGNIVLGSPKLGIPIRANKIAGQAVFQNLSLSGFSDKALEQLIEHKNHFQNGINISQLPQGFVLVSHPKNPQLRVLHYDENLEHQNSLAPQVVTSSARVPLSLDLTEKLLKKYPERMEVFTSMEPYSRVNSEIFRKYLPEILVLSDEQYKTLMALCTVDGVLDFKKLDFVFKNLGKAKNAYQDPYSEDALIDIGWLTEQFPEAQARQQYINFAHQADDKIALEHSLFDLLAKDNLQLVNALKTYQLTNAQYNGLLALYDKYGVGGLEKLLNTWEQMGPLLKSSPNIFNSVKSNTAGYESTLLNDDLLNAVRKISGFSKEQRKWWDKLYAAHTPANDNLVNLANDFAKFSQTIAEMGLQFHDIGAEPNFNGVTNLPTALGRMLTILNLTNPEDRKAQWEVMNKINLSATGAIYAMTAKQGSSLPCGFVLPEMNIDGLVSNEKGYNTVRFVKTLPLTMDAAGLQAFYRYIAHQQYRLPLDFYQDAVKGLEAARLDKSIPEDSIDLLYLILAEVTTGDNYRYFIDSPKAASDLWKGILTNFQKISLPYVPGVTTTMVKETAIDQLAQLPFLPPLPVLSQLVKISTTPLQNVGYSDIGRLKTLIPRLDASNRQLIGFINAYKNKIYLGMKFYGEDNFKKTYPEDRNLFEEHMEISRLIHEKGYGGDLLPLISTFKLGSEHIDKVATALDNHDIALIAPERVEKDEPINDEEAKQQRIDTHLNNLSPAINKYLLNYILSFFQDVENNKGLDADKLENLIHSLAPFFKQVCENYCKEFYELEVEYKAINSQISALDKGSKAYEEAVQQLVQHDFGRLSMANTFLQMDISQFEEFPRDKAKFLSVINKDVLPFIEKGFKANFPENYFENLRAGKPKVEVQLLIDKSFKNEALKAQVVSILAKFQNVSDKDQIQLVNSLASICDDLSQSDKERLFETLSDPRLGSASVSQYNQLLDSIDKYGVSNFIYFVEMATEFEKSTNKTINELVIKADYFLSQALPQIRNVKSETLTELDVVDLIVNLVLAAKNEEIEKKYDIAGTLIADYQRLDDAILSRNLEKIAAELKYFSDKYPDLKRSDSEAVKRLEEHLEWYKEDEFTVVEETNYRVEIRAKESVANTLKQNSFIGGFLKFVGTKVEVETEEIRVPYTVKKQVKVGKKLDPDLFSAVSGEITGSIQELQSYNYAVAKTLAMIESMVQKYPTAKTMLLAFTQHFLSFSESDGTQVEQAFDNLALIHKEFTAVNNKDIVISLCEHFGSKEENEPNYQDFIAILQGKKVSDELDFKNYPNLSEPAKEQVLKVITSLLNNDKPCSLKDIETLINNSIDPDYVEILGALFEFAPFPTLDLINNDWIKNAANDDKNKVKERVIEQYNQWNKNPVPREIGDKAKGIKGVNGFDLEHAKEQVKAMQGVEYTDEELKALEQEVDRVRTLSTKDLLAEIGQLKNKGNDPETPTKLVAALAELLHRTKGLPQEGVGQSRKWGNSFEINTTQYLAIHSMLKTGGHVTSQIGTGEGKSRIMMIAIACQYALGNTVDFVTSDLSLATRDYLEYQSYFKVLGAETNLIYAQTPAEEYRIGGINFSDASNLSLFRNKARSEGKQQLVLDPREEKRALMLDEADKTYFDSSDTRFNYSAQADASIRDIPWVYELMVDFFSVSENQDLYYADASQCNERFYNFASGKLSEVQMARLVFNPKMPMPVISRNQLEAWQSSALTALALEVNKDFTIISEVKIQTKEGAQKVSQAQLISGGRASGNAKFSFGVHQCLHARLNLLKKHGDSSEALLARASELTDSLDSQNRHAKELSDVHLGIELMNCSRFYIDSENQIVYSSSSKALVDDYHKGALIAVTGSMGGIQEQDEAAELYGTSGGEPMTFIDVPRHKRLNRQDLPVMLANDQRQHFDKVLDSVREGLSKNPPQPILLVCENDTESQRLYDFLNAKLSPTEKAALQRISAKTRISDEAKHVNEVAGKPGAITISTAMLGRGTDIRLHKEARVVDGQSVGAPTTNGLRVIGTYLPKGRDYIQIIGRAGRFGALGESQLVLDKERVTKQIGQDTLPTEFYTATEDYLGHLQQIMEADKQKQRIIKNAVGDFRLKLTNKFFEDFYSPLSKNNDKDNLLVAWQAFFDKTDKSWNETWPAITSELDKSPANMADVKRLLAEYQRSVKDEWSAMNDYLKAQIKEGQIKCETGEDFVNQTLKVDGVGIHLRRKEESLLDRDIRNFGKGSLQTTIASEYSEAYVGRAVIYTSFIDGTQAFFNNIGAAMRGDGPWFPNLQAAWNGNMSWTQFFFGTWGSPPERLKPIEPVVTEEKGVEAPKATVNGSYRTMVEPMHVTEELLKSHKDQGEPKEEVVHQQEIREDKGLRKPAELPSKSENEGELRDDKDEASNGNTLHR